MFAKPLSAKARYGIDCLVDAQVHLWPPNAPPTPWPTGRLSPPQKPYPISAEAMLFQMDLAGVDRAVIVPPSWAGESNQFALDAATRYPERFAVMGRFDIFAPPDEQAIRQWRSTSGLLGIRLFLFSEAERAMLTGSGLDWFWRATAQAGVPVTMMCPGLPQAAQVIERILVQQPELRLSMDHMNLLPTVPQSLTEELPLLMRLAKYPNFALKASGLPSMSQQRYPFADLHAVLKDCFDHFGPKRLFWGTDLTRSVCSYVENVTWFTEHLPWLRGDDLQQVMGAAVCAWYGWPIVARKPD